MTRTHSSVGLDIGSSAVRAAEVAAGRGRPRLLRVGQVGLPPGAVKDGEIVDGAAVSAAVRRLWGEAGFTSSEVVVGVSSQRVLVRQADVSAMSEGDFRSALEFEVGDLLPIPFDEAVMDFRILVPHLGAPEAGLPRMRVLVAAAHRSVIDAHLAAVQDAGLRARAVDVGGLAALRAADVAEPAQALVTLGADLTEVVVAEHGTLSFLRVLPRGGRALTGVLADHEQIPWPLAESIKRSGYVTARSEAVTDELGALIGRINDSLAYAATHLSGGQLTRVKVTGRATLLPGFLEMLDAGLPFDVEASDPLERVDTEPGAYPVDAHAQVRASAQVAIGLALRGSGRQLNLLPADVVVRRQRAAATRVAAGCLAGLVVVLAAASTVEHHRATVEQQVAATDNAGAAAEQRQIDRLSWVTESLSAVQDRQKVVGTLSAGDVDWDAVMQRLAAALPSGAALTSVSFQPGAEATTAGAADTSTTAPTSSAPLASINMAVTAQGGEDEVAVFLRSMATVPWLHGLWVPSSSASGGKVTFSASATIASGAPLMQRAGASK